MITKTRPTIKTLDCDHTAILGIHLCSTLVQKTGTDTYVRRDRLMLARPIAAFPKTYTEGHEYMQYHTLVHIPVIYLVVRVECLAVNRSARRV